MSLQPRVHRPSTSSSPSATTPPAKCAPYGPGKPITAHWGIADPAAAEGPDADKAFAFRKAFKELETRIKLFVQLPIASLEQMTLKEKLRAIGRAPPPTVA